MSWPSRMKISDVGVMGSKLFICIYYGTFVLFSALSVREIGTAHFGFEGRNKEHKGPRLSISTLTGPWVK